MWRRQFPYNQRGKGGRITRKSTGNAKAANPLVKSSELKMRALGIPTEIIMTGIILRLLLIQRLLVNQLSHKISMRRQLLSCSYRMQWYLIAKLNDLNISDASKENSTAKATADAVRAAEDVAAARVAAETGDPAEKAVAKATADADAITAATMKAKAKAGAVIKAEAKVKAAKAAREPDDAEESEAQVLPESAQHWA